MMRMVDTSTLNEEEETFGLAREDLYCRGGQVRQRRFISPFLRVVGQVATTQ